MSEIEACTLIAIINGAIQRLGNVSVKKARRHIIFMQAGECGEIHDKLAPLLEASTAAVFRKRANILLEEIKL